MPNLIYVHTSGEHDRARWLYLDLRSDGQLVFHLQDLCHPGRLSQLRHVACPPEFLEIALDRGTLQVTTNFGYLLIKPAGEHLILEFRGLDDISIQKVTVVREEVRARLLTLMCEARSRNAAEAR
ncbi:MAG: hypothetical protein ACO1SV_26745 [Fimbriimonas sp.]